MWTELILPRPAVSEIGSVLSAVVISSGGCAQRYSHCKGYELSTRAGTERLKHDLLENRPRVVWFCLLAQWIAPSNDRNQGNVLHVFLWLVDQVWCETIFEQLWVPRVLVEAVCLFSTRNIFVEEKHRDVSGFTRCALVRILVLCVFPPPMVRILHFTTMFSRSCS